jgi:hypothetical protein
MTLIVNNIATSNTRATPPSPHHEPQTQDPALAGGDGHHGWPLGRGVCAGRPRRPRHPARGRHAHRHLGGVRRRRHRGLRRCHRRRRRRRRTSDQRFLLLVLCPRQLIFLSQLFHFSYCYSYLFSYLVFSYFYSFIHLFIIRFFICCFCVYSLICLCIFFFFTSFCIIIYYYYYFKINSCFVNVHVYISFVIFT